MVPSARRGPVIIEGLSRHCDGRGQPATQCHRRAASRLRTLGGTRGAVSFGAGMQGTRPLRGRARSVSTLSSRQPRRVYFGEAGRVVGAGRAALLLYVGLEARSGPRWLGDEAESGEDSGFVRLPLAPLREELPWVRRRSWACRRFRIARWACRTPTRGPAQARLAEIRIALTSTAWCRPSFF
jgi:hypothetical protein